MSIYFTFLFSFFLLIGRHTGRILIILYALKLGARPFTIGILAAMSEVLPTALSWHAGRLADRFGSRWLLMTSSLAGALGMMVSYLFPGLPSLFVTALLYGLLSALSGAPMQNLVGLQSSPQDRAKNYSNFTLVSSSAIFISPLLAGFSLDQLGPRPTCLNMVLLALAPLVLLIVWGRDLPKGTRTAKPTEGIKALLAESGLWRVMTTSSLMVIGVDLFQVYVPIYGNGIGLSASAIGIVLASHASAAFVVRFFIPVLLRRFSTERVLACAFLMGAAGSLLLPFFKAFAVLILFSFLFGLGMGCGQPITMMMTFSSSNQGRSGEAMGLRVTMNNLTRLICQPLFGSLGSAFGVLTVFGMNALLLVSGWAVSRPRGTGRRPDRSPS